MNGSQKWHVSLGDSETGRKFKWNFESYSIGLSVGHGMTKKQVEDEEEEVEEDDGSSTGWWKITYMQEET